MVVTGERFLAASRFGKRHAAIDQRTGVVGVDHQRAIEVCQRLSHPLGADAGVAAIDESAEVAGLAREHAVED
jgi:hypothetical protein